MATFTYDGRAVAYRKADTVLTALLRAGERPSAGGCLCFGGDCPHCVATVDGISYVRTCQVLASDTTEVSPHPPTGYPPLTAGGEGSVSAQHEFCDVVVIGQGRSGRAAAAAAADDGHTVFSVDAAAGEEAVGIYPGPLAVVRTRTGMRLIECDRVVVATGTAEEQPVVPGNDLAGIYTLRAAEHLAGAGVDLGTIVVIGETDGSLGEHVVEGELRRINGVGTVSSVDVARPDGSKTEHECTSLVVATGRHPRDALVRMAGVDPVEVVGSAAAPARLPPAPTAGLLCPCAAAEVADIESVWERGFREIDLIKRSTLAGTGTCQGSVCLPHLRSLVAARVGPVPDPFTARPVTRQLTMAEAAAGEELAPFRRTSLDPVHRELGATMDRFGGWWRPWNYGNHLDEYAAVRERVSLGDVSTLGKMVVSGPDATAFLERLYPCHVADLAPGQSRYALLLDERGYVFDDGLICRESEDRYTLTFTSGGASFAEMWVRDWAEGWAMDVRIQDRTMAMGAINVTGPRSTELLAAAGFREPLGYMRHTKATVAGVPCQVFRLSFTGEASYELHHPADRSVELWYALAERGESFGVAPHGLQALFGLRLEKGHVIVGMDTDFDSTPRRIAHDWAVKMDKPEFIGRTSLERTASLPLDRVLAGFTMDGPAPMEGEVMYLDGQLVGYTTSTFASPKVGTVLLGWLDVIDGSLPTSVLIDGRTATRARPPFYDPSGARTRA